MRFVYDIGNVFMKFYARISCIKRISIDLLQLLDGELTWAGYLQVCKSGSEFLTALHFNA